nr:hypothetical protein Iba_scaffold137CG0380 [Ipomoea batatas]
MFSNNHAIICLHPRSDKEDTPRFQTHQCMSCDCSKAHRYQHAFPDISKRTTMLLIICKKSTVHKSCATGVTTEHTSVTN